MSEDELPADATETIAEATEADHGLIVAFVVCILLGLGVLGWHYHSSDKTAPISTGSKFSLEEKCPTPARS